MIKSIRELCRHNRLKFEHNRRKKFFWCTTILYCGRVSLSLLQISFYKEAAVLLRGLCFTFSNDAIYTIIELPPFLYDNVKFALFNYYNFLEYLLINFWSIIEHNRLTLKA